MVTLSYYTGMHIVMCFVFATYVANSQYMSCLYNPLYFVCMYLHAERWIWFSYAMYVALHAMYLA